MAVFLFVTAAWVVSLCLHEYAHARTALHSGDISIGAKGYLTLNPLKYTHALLSIVLPRALRDHGRDRSAGRRGLHRAGPHPGPLEAQPDLGGGPADERAVRRRVHGPVLAARPGRRAAAFRYALAFLALLQVTAAILNFLPVPGLDGYGVIEPWLSYGVRRQVEPFAPFGLLAVFALLWIP